MPLTVTILLIIIVLFLLAGSGLIYFVGVYQPQKMHADATATVNAQITSTAQANAQATANALATSTTQANATATAQASATAAASATATALQAILSQATSGNPTFTDSLSTPSNNNWDQLPASNSTQSGSCAYSGGAYESSMPTKGYFKPGLNQTNTITVVARGGSMYFYINGQYIGGVSNTTLSSGKIGVFGESFNNSTIVAFSNAEVWQL